VPEAARFFSRTGYAGSGSAAFTKIPLLRVRFQRAIGLGWGASRQCPPEPFVHYPVGLGRCDVRLCKKRHIITYD
jgi:hypothetical protein